MVESSIYGGDNSTSNEPISSECKCMYSHTSNTSFSDTFHIIMYVYTIHVGVYCNSLPTTI